MDVRVNGDNRTLPDGTTIAALVEQLGLQPGQCAAAVNLDFVPRSAYAQTVLRAGDQVEIVTPRQGG